MVRVRYILNIVIALAPMGARAFSSFGARASDSGARASDMVFAQVQLSVAPLQQFERNSCGEAALTIAYNYANPSAPLNESAVIDYAKTQGLYMPHTVPFTSPASMVALGQAFAGTILWGNVSSSSDEGLLLLSQELQAGSPVIIDVTTRLNDLGSGAHFVVVTGLATDPWSGEVTVTYSNPLDGLSEQTAWSGEGGIWEAWQNNGDPGGSGWWLVLPSTDLSVPAPTDGGNDLLQP